MNRSLKFVVAENMDSFKSFNIMVADAPIAATQGTDDSITDHPTQHPWSPLLHLRKRGTGPVRFIFMNTC